MSNETLERRAQTTVQTTAKRTPKEKGGSSRREVELYELAK